MTSALTPDLEGNTSGIAFEYEMDLNGSCLWYLYAKSDAPPPIWADLAAETHTVYQHAPGTPQAPLVFSQATIQSGGKWGPYMPSGRKTPGSTEAFYCSTDAGVASGTGKSFTFAVHGTLLPDPHLEPAACIGNTD